MKTVLVFAFAMFFSAPTSYPMRAKIVSIHAQTQNGFTVEQGYGNIGFAAAAAHDHWTGGFEFVAEGCAPFEASHGPTAYAGRLKDSHTLIIAMSPVGSDKVNECKLKITMRPFLYAITDGGQLTTVSL